MSTPLVESFHSAIRQRAIAGELAHAGWTGEQALFAKSAADLADKAGMPQRVAALMVACLNSAGEQHKQAAIVYGRLAALPEWDVAYDPFLDVAYEVLAGSYAKKADASASTTALLAGMRGGNNVMTQAMMGSQSAIATLLSASVLGGAGLGAMNWHLRRQASDDDEDNAALAGKIRVLREQNASLREPAFSAA